MAYMPHIAKIVEQQARDKAAAAERCERYILARKRMTRKLGFVSAGGCACITCINIIAPSLHFLQVACGAFAACLAGWCAGYLLGRLNWGMLSGMLLFCPVGCIATVAMFSAGIFNAGGYAATMGTALIVLSLLIAYPVFGGIMGFVNHTFDTDHLVV